MNSASYRYKSVDVAEYIVCTASERNIPMNMTKLQKLLYISYGIFLSVTKERLTDEHPQAWPYGPVFPATRNQFLKAPFYAPECDKSKKIYQDEDVKSLVDLVFNVFGDWTAGQLTEWSHAEDTPWDRAKCSPGLNKWGREISDNDIYEYFSKMLATNG